VLFDYTMIEQQDHDCRVTTPAPVPTSKDEEPVSELFRAWPPAESDPEPDVREPVESARAGPEDPTDPALDSAAQQLSRLVWRDGGAYRGRLFPRGMTKSAQDDLINYAVERGWIKEGEDTMVTPGTVNPTPLITTRIPN